MTFPIENIPLFENHRSETEHNWMFPGKPNWGCWVLSQTGTLLGSRIWSLRFSSGADVQTEIPDMAEDDCLTWSESEALHRFLSKFLMDEVPIHLLQRCFNMIWTWHTRSLMYMLHVSQSRCQHKTCQHCSRRKISLLWFQAVFLHEWNVLFLETTTLWHDWQICFLFEGSKVHSQCFTFHWAANLWWSLADESKKKLF